MNTPDNIEIFDTEALVNTQIANEIAQLLSKKPDALLCIAAGNTSLGLFDELAAREQHGTLSLSQCWFVAMDEWKDMNETVPGSCSDFLRRHFLSRVSIQEDRIRLVNGKAADLQHECDEVRNFIAQHGAIDYLVLGCGMNGHLALNEPGTPFDSDVHCSQLDAVTMRVGQKYFTSAHELTGGVTIGLKNVSQARRVVLSVCGSHKAAIVARLLAENPSPQLPATIVRTLTQGNIYCDRDAASLCIK